MKIISFLWNSIFAISVLIIAGMMLQDYFTANSAEISKLEQLKKEGQSTMGLFDDAAISIGRNSSRSLTYRFSTDGKKYNGTYTFDSDKKEILSPNVEVTYLKENPEISSVFLEEELQEAYNYSESKVSLFLGIGMSLFGLALMYLNLRQVGIIKR